MGSVALSSKIVLVKFVLVPLAPRFITRGTVTCDPFACFGEIRLIRRSESLVEEMLSWTARWEIRKLPSGSFGMTSVELSWVPDPVGTCGVTLSDQPFSRPIGVGDAVLSVILSVQVPSRALPASAASGDAGW